MRLRRRLAEDEWPSVTILVAAWNESEAIVRTLEHIAELSYKVGWRSSLPTTTRPTTRHRLRTRRVHASASLPTCFRGEAREAQRAERGPRDSDDTAGGDGGCRHPSAASVGDSTRGSPDHRTAGPTRLRLCGRARCGEPAGDLRHPDAAMGLPAGDQRRQTDAGGVQHRARRAGGVLRVLDD